MSIRRRFALHSSILFAILLCVTSNVAFSQGPPEVIGAQHFDVSPPLRNIPAKLSTGPLHDRPLYRFRAPGQPGATDPVIQSSVSSTVATSAGLNFDGVGVGLGSFTPNAAPPDTNGAVGATQYVQWVNESFAVFDKTTGALRYGPAAGNTLWSGFGGGCQTNNDGDPIVQYDKAANRWVMAQFSVSTTPYLLCVAVSTTSDATGPWYRYSFSQPNFPDYPKLGMWPDAFYVSYNMFQGNQFAGGRACAMDRSKMLAGQAATQVCFQLSNAYGGLLPSDLDGSTAPPAGSPNYYVAFGSNSLQVWKFHVDFATPSNSTFTSPTTLSVASFSEACGGGTCIPQGGVTQKLDSLADRLMYRLAYRNFGDHEAMVVNHSVTAGSSVGLRWYELRIANQAVSVYQQGTYAPDANYRWMGSIAMDKVGNMALGYSISSSTMYPSIRYTGRAPADTLGQMQAENTVFDGSGSQSGSNLNRWGDYSAMAIDPVDDCTFWYTNEYLKTTGAFNWSTRIASFSFPSCSGTVTAPAAPTNLVASGANAQVSLTWTGSTGATGYNVLRSSASGGPYIQIASVSTTSYTDTLVANGTTYYYVVQATNSAGTSGYSNQASATPLCSVPGVPPGLTASAGNNRVALSWAAVAGASSYNVKRSSDGGVTYPTVWNVTSTSYTDTTAANGTTYYYVVSAVSSCGESSNSSAVSATPSAPALPPAPTNLRASAGPGARKISLSWNPASGATSYNVKRATVNGGAYSLIATGVTTTSVTNTGLTSGTTYYYVVSAVNSAGQSGNSNQASATAK